MTIVTLALYGGAILALVLSIFWRPITGILFLAPLIPLQTLRYTLIGLPLGQSLIVIMLLGVALGLIRRGQSPLPKTPWTKLIYIYFFYTYFSLLLGSLFARSPFPFPGDERFGVWVDYMTMPALLLLVAAIQPTKRQAQVLVFLMCVSMLLVNRAFWTSVSGRDFSTFSNDIRGGEGQLGYAGLNGFAAFAAQLFAFLLALAAYQKRFLIKLALWALAAFSGMVVALTFSRGAYLAVLAGWLFISLAKQRNLLILFVVFLMSWTAFVPGAVQDRVTMTYDDQTGEVDHSSEVRLTLWEDAIQAFTSANVLVGEGFNTYQHGDNFNGYQDTHNIYVKMLVETGVIGLALFLWLLGSLFWKGLKFSRAAQDPFMASLGLGLAAWIVCTSVASLFGDRWTYFQVNGCYWVIAGLVAAGWKREQESLEESSAQNSEQSLEQAGAGTEKADASSLVLQAQQSNFLVKGC